MRKSDKAKIPRTIIILHNEDDASLCSVMTIGSFSSHGVSSFYSNQNVVDECKGLMHTGYKSISSGQNSTHRFTNIESEWENSSTMPQLPQRKKSFNRQQEIHKRKNKPFIDNLILENGTNKAKDLLTRSQSAEQNLHALLRKSDSLIKLKLNKDRFKSIMLNEDQLKKACSMPQFPRRKKSFNENRGQRSHKNAQWN